jgi:hypothetical protein
MILWQRGGLGESVYHAQFAKIKLKKGAVKRFGAPSKPRIFLRLLYESSTLLNEAPTIPPRLTLLPIYYS